MKKGFVLLETIVVTGVLGLLLVMMYPAFSNIISLSNNVSHYNNTDYLFRTMLYSEYVTEEIGSNDIKIICQGNCTNTNQKFFNIQAIYLANPKKINNILNREDIYITTKRYLKYVVENDEYDDIILVIAYKDEDATSDNYEYAMTGLSSGGS